MLGRSSAVLIGALAAACSLAGYSTAYDAGVVSTDAGGDGNVPPTANDASSEDAGVSSEAGGPLVDCLGALRPVFFCDGFEGNTSEWKPIRLPDARAVVEVALSPKIAGARSLRAGFSTLPAGGDAKLEFRRPDGGGPLSLQVSIYITNTTGWTSGQAVPLFELRSTTVEAIAVGTFVANGAGPNGKIELRVPDSLSIDLGPAVIEGWACYEIAFDGKSVTGFAGAANKGTSTGRAATDSVQIGMEWNYGENNDAGKHVYFDDVVIAPAPIGCLH